MQVVYWTQWNFKFGYHETSERKRRKNAECDDSQIHQQKYSRCWWQAASCCNGFQVISIQVNCVELASVAISRKCFLGPPELESAARGCRRKRGTRQLRREGMGNTIETLCSFSRWWYQVEVRCEGNNWCESMTDLFWIVSCRSYPMLVRMFCIDYCTLFLLYCIDFSLRMSSTLQECPALFWRCRRKRGTRQLRREGMGNTIETLCSFSRWWYQVEVRCEGNNWCESMTDLFWIVSCRSYPMLVRMFCIDYCTLFLLYCIDFSLRMSSTLQKSAGHSSGVPGFFCNILYLWEYSAKNIAHFFCFIFWFLIENVQRSSGVSELIFLQHTSWNTQNLPNFSNFEMSRLLPDDIEGPSGN